MHCVKSARIWNFSGPNVDNTDQKNSEYQDFLRSDGKAIERQ